MGDPIAQPRVRATVRSGHAMIYTPDNAEEWKVRLAASAYQHISAPTDVGVNLSLAFVLARPRSHLRTNGHPKGSARPLATSKPDLDNLAKAALDAMNGIAYTDDALVVGLNLSKRWAEPGEDAGVTVTISHAQ